MRRPDEDDEDGPAVNWQTGWEPAPDDDDPPPPRDWHGDAAPRDDWRRWDE